MRPSRPIRKKKSGLVVLSDAGELIFANKYAQALLIFHFSAWEAGEPLPRPLRMWIAGVSPASHHSRGSVSEPWRIEKEGRKLSVRMVSTEREKILLLDEESIPVDALRRGAETLRILGMTERESEVLFWVSAGKSNPEIGIILHIALRTVKKHLEHIFAKLGVENRTCAAARASDVLHANHRSPTPRVSRRTLVGTHVKKSIVFPKAPSRE